MYKISPRAAGSFIDSTVDVRLLGGRRSWPQELWEGLLPMATGQGAGVPLPVTSLPDRQQQRHVLPVPCAPGTCKGPSAHSPAGVCTADVGPCQVGSVQASERREARGVLSTSSLPLEGRCMERKVCLPRTVKWPLFQIMKKGPVGVCAGVKTLGLPLVLLCALQLCLKPAVCVVGPLDHFL